MIDVLIVEDEPGIAEIHSQFLQQLKGFRPVSIAGDLAQARQMAAVLKPQLVLLDHFLPDGNGLSLLTAWAQQALRPDVIYLTAANTMDIVRPALGCGVFDYLIKPINYQRLKESLLRYQAYHQSLQGQGRIQQSELDALLARQGHVPEQTDAGAGIDSYTLEQVLQCFTHLTCEYSAESMARETGLSKTTARRYLDYCARKGKLVASLQHGKVGRPIRTYMLPRPAGLG
ncbi:response regulator [Photobacterium sp. MCCC 1A19761]|uniref:response regulator n=1 Tax=Photobacterium sp. MCCC 1A19761 TaxID=3115000 RepID=UPI00307DF27A